MNLKVFIERKPRRIVLSNNDFEHVMECVEKHNPKNQTDEIALFFHYVIYYGYATKNPKGSYQCDHSRNRSLTDMYRLIYSYYDITLEQYIKALNRLYVINSNKDYKIETIGTLFCPHVRKMVFSKPYKHGSPFSVRNSYFIPHISTEFNMSFSKFLNSINLSFDYTPTKETVSVQTI